MLSPDGVCWTVFRGESGALALVKRFSVGQEVLYVHYETPGRTTSGTYLIGNIPDKTGMDPDHFQDRRVELQCLRITYPPAATLTQYIENEQQMRRVTTTRYRDDEQQEKPIGFLGPASASWLLSQLQNINMTSSMP